MRLRNHLADKRGISLVEVLAALAVFVVGILAIVRMFPPGFMVVKQSENFTLANRLSQSELERLKGTAANLPVGILGWDPAGSGGVITNIAPDDLSDLASMPGNPYYSDVNKFRHIYAEATKIPSPIDYNMPHTSPGDPLQENAVYVLNFSPIEWAGTDSIVVRSGPMRRRTVIEDDATKTDAENGLVVKSPSDYAIDYRRNEARVYVRKQPYERTFVITYSYWTNTGGRPQLHTVLGETVRVMANSCLANIPSEKYPSVRNEPGFMYIDSGSDSLHRKFNEIPIGDAFDPYNPYQYKVLDNVRGVLGFNPAGFGYEEQTSWGRMALTAYIDYDVLDWHIIREDRKLPDSWINPGGSDQSVRLTLRFIKNAGLSGAKPPIRPATVEFNGNTYAGLSPSMAYSILAIDIQTGECYNEESMIGSDWAMEVNYKDGIIKFHPNLAGRTFRIYYRAEGDWALQVFKSYESYRQSYGFDPTDANAKLDYREWFARSTTDSSESDPKTPYYCDANPSNGQAEGLISFAKCYDGMSVALDYTYRVKVDKQYRYYSVDGDSYQTEKRYGSNSNTCGIDPRVRIAGVRNCTPDDVQIVKIAKVYGVSVGARVIWREGGKGFNAGQWRKVDLQTYLMKQQD